MKPVKKRASTIHKEYEDKMRKVDKVADAGLHSPKGLLLKELKKYGRVGGLVVGAFGEFSKDLKSLMASIVDAKVPGDPKMTQAARSWAWAKVRRTLGLSAVRSNAQFKLGGLRWCGPGGKEAYARRLDKRKAADIGKATLRAMYNYVHCVTHRSRDFPPRD